MSKEEELELRNWIDSIPKADKKSIFGADENSHLKTFVKARRMVCHLHFSSHLVMLLFSLEFVCATVCMLSSSSNKTETRDNGLILYSFLYFKST